MERRCDWTGNPCGTDTHLVGKPCECYECEEWRKEQEEEAKRLKIDNNTLDKITLDVADLLRDKYGVDGYQYHECMYVLRHGLHESLVMSGARVAPMCRTNWTKLREDRK